MSNQLIPQYVEVRSAAIFSEVDAETCLRICAIRQDEDPSMDRGRTENYCPLLKALWGITSGPELWEEVQKWYLKYKGRNPPVASCPKKIHFQSIEPFLEPQIDNGD